MSIDELVVSAGVDDNGVHPAELRRRVHGGTARRWKEAAHRSAEAKVRKRGIPGRDPCCWRLSGARGTDQIHRTGQEIETRTSSSLERTVGADSRACSWAAMPRWSLREATFAGAPDPLTGWPAQTPHAPRLTRVTGAAGLTVAVDTELRAEDGRAGVEALADRPPRIRLALPEGSGASASWPITNGCSAPGERLVACAAAARSTAGFRRPKRRIRLQPAARSRCCRRLPAPPRFQIVAENGDCPTASPDHGTGRAASAPEKSRR